MLISRRGLLIGTLLPLVAPALAGQEKFPSPFEIPIGKFPGDYGYLHNEYHVLYSHVFGDILKCSCGDGECRVTYWRESRLGSSKGFDVIVNRAWHPLPISVQMPNPEDVSAALRKEPAHVCAYGDDSRPTIACVIINATQG